MNIGTLAGIVAILLVGGMAAGVVYAALVVGKRADRGRGE